MIADEPATENAEQVKTGGSERRLRLTLLPTRKRAALIGALALVATVGGVFMFSMPGKSHSGPLAPLTPDETVMAPRLRAHVEHLATSIGPRHVNAPAELQAAADWITAEFETLGLAGKREEFEVGGVTVANVVAEVAGTSRPSEIIVVGAHYDSVPYCPAANDNASGVAGLIELARALVDDPHERTLRLVAFVNEEPPWFHGEHMGSLVHAEHSKARGDDVRAMISLETIGYYDDAPGSQTYPPPLNFIYPDTGNFIAFVGNLGSRALVRRVVRSFRGHTPFPSEGAAAPAALPGIGWSDHWSFWQSGYPALMVTDTAPFRYPHYHRESDVPEHLDYERMARVVAGVTRVTAELLRADE